MTHQTIATGTIPKLKYSKLGGFTGRIIQPADRITAMIFGEAGQGKSALLQSNPNAFIFNLDRSSTVTSTVKAQIWPAMDPTTGETLDDTGKPAPLTYEAIIDKIRLLKDLARTGEERPATIVFDSLSAWLQLLKEYIPRNAVALALRRAEDGAASTWRELQGQSAYDTMADLVAQTIVELQSAGYGVYIVAHIVKDRIVIDDKQQGYDFKLTCYGSVWRRILHLLELSLCAIVKEEVEEVTHENTFTDPKTGKIRTATIKRNKPVTRYYLCNDLSSLSGITKKRVPDLPGLIRIPTDEKGHAVDGWAAFTAAYEQAKAASLT